MAIYWYFSVDFCVSLFYVEGNVEGFFVRFQKLFKVNVSNIYFEGKRLVIYILKVKTEIAIFVGEGKFIKFKVIVYIVCFCFLGYDILVLQN